MSSKIGDAGLITGINADKEVMRKTWDEVIAELNHMGFVAAGAEPITGAAECRALLGMLSTERAKLADMRVQVDDLLEKRGI